MCHAFGPGTLGAAAKSDGPKACQTDRDLVLSLQPSAESCTVILDFLGSPVDEKVAHYQVTFVTDTGEVRTEAAADQYLLDVAAAAGLDLPYMCLQGWCTTCAGKILQGQVDQSEALRIYPEDEAAGFVLLCSAFPRSDLRILTNQKEQLRTHRHQHGLPAPRG